MLEISIKDYIEWRLNVKVFELEKNRTTIKKFEKLSNKSVLEEISEDNHEKRM